MNDQVAPGHVLGGAPGSEGAPGPEGAPGSEGAAGSEGVAGVQPYLDNLVTAVFAPAMSVSGRDGQMRSEAGVAGLYVHDLRALNQFVLTVDGSEPVQLGYELVGGPANEFHGAVVGAGNPGPDLTVFVSRRRTLTPYGMVERFTLRSCARAALHCQVEVRVGSDLAAISEIRSGWRPAPQAAAPHPDGLAWSVAGRASVRLAGTPAPAAVDAAKGSLSWDFGIEPGQVTRWSVQVELQDLGAAPPMFVAPPPSVPNGFPALDLEANDQRLVRLVGLSLADLAGLQMAAPASPSEVFLAAGAPWYLTLFGRDSIWAARLLLPLGSDLARGTLRTLASRQGRKPRQVHRRGAREDIARSPPR